MVVFSTQELDIASDPITLLIKNRVMEKAAVLMGEFEQIINDSVKNWQLPDEINIQNGKISKGENYKFLPYVLLDFPAYYTKQDVFAIRSMFYWGNFISFTIHLKGKYLLSYGRQLINTCKVSDQLYYCVNNKEWEYHYKESNYKQLSDLNDADINDQIEEHGFIKLSIQQPIENIHNSFKYLNELLQLIKPVFKQLG